MSGLLDKFRITLSLISRHGLISKNLEFRKLGELIEWQGLG